ncbi:AurF N-oxygenase family protein [Actinomadura parmotrematis]|uniref:Diiron oxygenase n=1 Tax=Actinomadura parmotrematis TaxID=2864039 RepID=A0ABS7FLZ2_9ACTN|nr:diiron oxygenase [Actinomadura parmotrematis]MBW8481386.1 diiron oxygenase [Actinomadura parmotrematis]
MATTGTTKAAAERTDGEYAGLLRTLSEGSVHRRFDPYLDIDWDGPDYRIDPEDERWQLSKESDPLGAHPWYWEQPLEKRIAIGRWRQANVSKVGLAFESILIRGMMQYVMTLPNGSPEFRYCLHEMTEECNHIQMFQELVNRIGVDVPGMKAPYRITSPLWSLSAYAPTLLFIGILAGEEPIDHVQKAIIREGAHMPPAVLRTMEIHIAEEARHISFAHRFLQERVARQGRVAKGATSLAFPLVMRWLAGAIMAPPRDLAKEHGIPRKVMREAFWKNPKSKDIMRGFFGDVRKLAEELDLMNPASRALWRMCGIDGRVARFRGEPDRRARAAA